MTQLPYRTAARRSRGLVASLAFGAALCVAAAPGFAAGTGTSDPAPAPQPAPCPEGQTCEDTKNHDDDVYRQGVTLAKAGDYERAIAVLMTASNQNDPRVLNYIGYSYRKLGQFGTGIAYYGRALDLNPDFVLAREYLGEGFVSIGRIDKAEEQLAEIEQRCGAHCTEYQELAQVISDARNGQTSEW
jgi:tetratricopeptide (TPR) repeat protein